MLRLAWTGTEPPKAYGTRRDADKHSFWLWTALWTPLAALCLFVPLNQGGSGGGAWGLVRPAGYLIAVFAVGCLYEAVRETLQHAKEARPDPLGRPWALHVGPDSIVTVGAAGRREFPWEQIRDVSVEEIMSSAPYRYTGVHVRLAAGAGRPPKMPAGWTHPEPKALTVRATGTVPVCVLGPMTTQQHLALAEALDKYGRGQRR
ncbi:hypothetical protein GTW69_34070 [Streptomyces sp. SID7760]|nr:hypothetical protein [Streptomyces sp. SID7760]